MLALWRTHSKQGSDEGAFEDMHQEVRGCQEKIQVPGLRLPVQEHRWFEIARQEMQGCSESNMWSSLEESCWLTITSTPGSRSPSCRVFSRRSFLLDTTGIAPQKLKIVLSYMFKKSRKGPVEQTPTEIDAAFDYINKNAVINLALHQR
eukprot:6086599-Amphidinium_carterae.1